MATLKLPLLGSVSDFVTTSWIWARSRAPRASSTFTASAVAEPRSFDPVWAMPCSTSVLRPRIPLVLMEWTKSIIAAIRPTSSP